jgi:PPM family protein phosphatase
VTTEFRAAALTDVGQVRATNQDNCLADADLFAVADGMGGHSGGEVASEVALAALREHFDVATTDRLVDSVQAANEAVIARADEDSGLRGMGTTLVALADVVTDGEARLAVVNVGDSRCYLLTDDGLRQITRDHSVVQTLVDNGQITAAEAEQHPQRNILTRALGIDQRIMADSWELLPYAGDRYLLCSDGLFNEVSEAEIIEVLRTEGDPNAAAAALVSRANASGGRDNISVVLVDVVADDGRAAAAEASLERLAAHTTAEHRALVSVGAEAGPRPDAVVDGDDDPDTEARRGPSFRTVAFTGAVIAVLAALVGTVVFVSRGSYHVGFDDDVVVIFQGRPGGFMGIDPNVNTRSTLTRDEVPADRLEEIGSGVEFSSLGDAEEYLATLEAESADSTAGPRMLPPPPAVDPFAPDGDPDDLPGEGEGDGDTGGAGGADPADGSDGPIEEIPE